MDRISPFGIVYRNVHHYGGARAANCCTTLSDPSRAHISDGASFAGFFRRLLLPAAVSLRDRLLPSAVERGADQLPLGVAPVRGPGEFGIFFSGTGSTAFFATQMRYNTSCCGSVPAPQLLLVVPRFFFQPSMPHF